MASQSMDVQLLGQKISLKTEGDPELMREVINLVNSRLEAAELRTKTPTPHHVTLLALLDLAEEYVQAKRRLADHQRAIGEKSQQLKERIEAEFK